MKQLSKLTFIYCLLLIAISSFAQTKPSKQTTIKYINDKLNANCIGECKIENETWYKYGSPSLQYYKSATYEGYSVEEIDGVAYIIITEKYRVKQYDFDTKQVDDNYSSNTIKIPITKVNDVMIFDIPKKAESGTIAKSSEGYRGIFFTTSGNNIIYYNGNKDATSYINIYIIPSLNTDFEENFKKAILNLKTYYKADSDPFSN